MSPRGRRLPTLHPSSRQAEPSHEAAGADVQVINALVCTAPGHLQMERRPAPSPAPTLALVRPLRVGVCGTDYHIFQGKHPFLNYPRVMGHELAVEVVEAPPGSPVAAGAVCVVDP